MARASTSPDGASSSSSASTEGGPESFAGFLDESLAALARDCPRAYAETLRGLAGAPVLVDVGGEQVLVAAGEGGHALGPPAGAAPAAVLVTRPPVLLALLDGEASVLDCLLDDRLQLTGAVAALLRLEGALSWYLRGAVRTGAFEDLLHRFRRWARGCP